MPPLGGLLLGGVPPSRGSPSGRGLLLGGLLQGVSFLGGSPSWGSPSGGLLLEGGASFLGVPLSQVGLLPRGSPF